MVRRADAETSRTRPSSRRKGSPKKVVRKKSFGRSPSESDSGSSLASQGTSGAQRRGTPARSPDQTRRRRELLVQPILLDLPLSNLPLSQCCNIFAMEVYYMWFS